MPGKDKDLTDLIPAKDIKAAKKKANDAKKAATKAQEETKKATQAKAEATKATKKAQQQLEKAMEGLTGSRERVGEVLGTVAGRAKEARALEAVMPGKDKIRIRWRDPSGKLHDIHDYTIEEVALDGDIKAFVNRRLRPSIGDYDYVISMLKEDGTVVPYGVIPQARPSTSSGTPGNDTVDVLRTTLEALKQQQANPTQQVDPIDQLTKLVSVKDKLFGGEQQGGGGMDLMQMMMLKDMLKPPEPQMDPQIVSLIERMDRRLDMLESKAAEPPPLPPLPPAEPAEPPIDVVRLVEAMRPPEPPPPPTDQLTINDVLGLVKEMRPPEKEGITLEKVITLGPALAGVLDKVTGRDLMEKRMDELSTSLKDMRGSGGLGGLDEEIGKLVRLQQVIPRLFPQSKTAEGWIDFANNMWETLPNTIRESRGLVRDIVNAQEKVPRRPQRSRKLRQEREQEPQRAEDAGEPDEGDTLEMNEEGVECIKAMVDGETVGEIMEAGVDFLQAVAPIPSWRKYVALLIYLAKEGKGDRVIAVLDGILGTLVEVDLMDEEDHERILGVFKKQEETVVSVLSQSAGVGSVKEEEDDGSMEVEPGA